MNKLSIKEMTIIGIDVSKAKLDCAWLRDENKVKTKACVNNPEGWKALVTWAQAHTGCAISELHFVMEATGIYHENLTTWLHDSGAKVSVFNPAHVKHYAQSLGARTKNDKKDSVLLARYALKESPVFGNPRRWKSEH
jgi:transposase